MTEIEIKAHVKDAEKVRNALNSFASFSCHLDKDDTYYHLPSSKNKKGFISVRIRKETEIKDGKTKKNIWFTYKNKETKIQEDGTSIEVNEENECELSDEKPLEKALLAAGAEISLKKEKHSDEWTMETEFGHANLELVEVPPLGLFLEIEILGTEENKNRISEIKTLEEEMIQKCGIQSSEIEPRYYSDLLKNR